MDNIVDSLENAYQEFVIAATDVLEAKETFGAQNTPVTEVALEAFKHKWELFRVACDQAEDFVESMKQRIGSELLMDEASGPVTRKFGQTGPTSLPTINGVRLQHMFKSVRRLLTELQHGSVAAEGYGTPASSTHSHPSTPFDGRFSEDST
ncbi:mediator of RNA polymerase II transcription subunit 32 [Prunus yedoensis var. nudiflora]|uniref:Mediator of RNA polymerase II transcription subunit 32 n=1 Tax=Prunus yedoensis var. nudiflora TaxID=2094558 RepID=A0A314YQ40_PRUYE|nr:mediator of RNA polymerase II transcription subunit 32 [Prunus yedoensis var. nudiflora]